MKNHFFVFFLVICLLPLTTATAQKPNKKFKKGGVFQLNDSLTTYGQSDIFTFPNVNTLTLYRDANKLKQIAQLEKSSNEKELYTALRDYVKNFGIENFSANTALLWQLAKLSQKYGEKGEAVLLYKLVLKHHRQNIDGNRVQQEYDTLTKNERDYFVPLEQYYQLVEYRKEIDTLRPPHGVLINMGPAINSSKADYAPTIGNVDTLLLFSSKRNAHAQVLDRTYDEDLFFQYTRHGCMDGCTGIQKNQY